MSEEGLLGNLTSQSARNHWLEQQPLGRAWQASRFPKLSSRPWAWSAVLGLPGLHSVPRAARTGDSVHNLPA